MGPIVRKVSLKEKKTTRVRGVENIASRAIRLFDRKGITKFSKLMGKVASSVLTAYLGFRDPKKRRREYLIPKDRAAWLEWMVTLAKKRIQIQHLTEKELRKVIIRARPNLAPHKKYHGPVEDPDLPLCIDWDVDEVASWLVSIGYPHLEKTFRENFITGRRLVLIDCTALNQMGMTDLGAMREVAGKIRDLLGIPPPNGIRPIARAPPFERFLRRKVYNGRSYDGMTFEKFCEVEGYNYDLLMSNKNAKIPCTCEVYITTRGAEEDEEGEEGEAAEELSLRNAPTVEFLVRNALVRNKTVDQIMEDLLQDVFRPPLERKYGRDLWGKMKRGIGEGFDDLHLIYSKEKLEFVTGVANSLIDELYKTVAVLNDINQLQQHIKQNITKDELNMFTTSAQILMEEVAPIAGLLALGELDLETIFKQEPQFVDYVDDIVEEAEKKTNELVPDARSFIDEVIEEALRRIPTLNLTSLAPAARESLLRMAYTVLHELSSETDALAKSVQQGQGKGKKGGGGGKEGGGTGNAGAGGGAANAGGGAGGTGGGGARGGGGAGGEGRGSDQNAPADGQNEGRPVSPSGTASSAMIKESHTAIKKGDGPHPGTRAKSIHPGTDKHDHKGGKGGKGKTKGKHDDERRDSTTGGGVESPVPGSGEGESWDAGEAEGDEGEEQELTVATALLRDGPNPRTPMTVSTASSNSYNRNLRSQDGVNTPLSRQDTPGTRGSRQFTAGGEDAGRANGSRRSDPSKDPRTGGGSQASGDRQGQEKTGAPEGLPKGPRKSGGSTNNLTQDQKRQSGDGGRGEGKQASEQEAQGKGKNVERGGAGQPGEKTSDIDITHPQARKTFIDINEKLNSARSMIPERTPPTQGNRYDAKGKPIPIGSEDANKDSKGNDIPRQSAQPKRDSKGNEIPRESAGTRRDSKTKEGHPHHDQHGKKHVATADVGPGHDNDNNNEKRRSDEGHRKNSLKKTRSTTFATKDSEGKGVEEDSGEFLDSAKEIWDNFKSQVSHIKISDKQNEDGIVELEINPEDVIKVESTITKLKLKRARTLISSHDDMKVDPEHLKKMMAHRKTIVEHWAKTEMEEQDTDTSPEEKARLVRITADKVVTEICTMALTHMLLEAEAGKNTGRIIQALKQIELQGLEEGNKSQENPHDVTLWNPNLPGSKPPINQAEEKKRASEPTKPARRSAEGTSSSPSPVSTVPESSIPRRTKSKQVAMAEEKKRSLDTLEDSQNTGPKSILQHGGTEKLKSQSKTVVVNAVKDALNDTTTPKHSLNQRASSSTAVKKNHYVTRL